MEINGLEELEAALLKKMALNEVKEVVAKSGAKLHQTMQGNADFEKGNQTGATKRSIELEITDDGLTAKVFPGTEYSPFLEYGTRYMQAQPFVKPSLEAVRPEFIYNLKNLVK